MSPRAAPVTNINTPRFTAHSRAMPQVEARCHLWSETISRAGSSFAPVVLKLTSATYKPPRPSTACATQHAHTPSGLTRTPFRPRLRKHTDRESVRVTIPCGQRNWSGCSPACSAPTRSTIAPSPSQTITRCPILQRCARCLQGAGGARRTDTARQIEKASLSYDGVPFQLSPPHCQHRFVRTLVFAHAGPACACWFEMRERGALTNSAM